MKKTYIMACAAISSMCSLQVFGIDPETFSQYHYLLLTDDYEILSEFNLKKYAEERAEPEMAPFLGKLNGLGYWQCFPTEQVSAYYEEGDYDASTDEQDILGDAHIKVKINSIETLGYDLRRNFSSHYAKEKVKIWNELMKDEAYVCLGGVFTGADEKIQEGVSVVEYSWAFDNLKTNKGCDSYFLGWCDLHSGGLNPDLDVEDRDNNELNSVDHAVLRPFLGEFDGVDSFQHFSTQNISMWYGEGYYDSHGKAVSGDAYIRMELDSVVIQDYRLGRDFLPEEAKNTVSRWRQLIQNESTVWIGGVFVEKKEIIKHGKKIPQYVWLFDILQTASGCDSPSEGACG